MRPTDNNPPWFAEWFDNELYTQVYAHRCEEEAGTAVALLLQHTGLRPGDKVLDLCCGSGRHARALHREGFAVNGLDLSPTLLEIAERETTPGGPHYFRGDMREPLPDAPYACISNFFTSFGYFEKRSDDALVLRRVYEALRKPDGMFFFDYLNAEHTRRTLVPHEEKTLGAMLIRQKRRIEGEFVHKSIRIREGEREYRFSEKVRLYTLADFEHMFAQAGLMIERIFGEYDGTPHSADSRRLIILARATGAIKAAKL